MSEFDRHARYYDVEHAGYQEDLAMYAGFATLAGDDGILELACGTGRCLLPLAESGARVTGLDISPAMLEVARQKVAARGLGDRVELVQGDMRAFELERGFRLIVIALNSLMHLATQEEQGAALRCAARHLAPGGRVVIDLFNPDVALPDTAQEGQLFLHCLKLLPESVHLLHFQSPRVDRSAQMIAMANFFDEIAADGTVKRFVAPFTLRYLTRGELDLLLPKSGLIAEGIYGTYDLDGFRGDSPRLIAVAGR